MNEDTNSASRRESDYERQQRIPIVLRAYAASIRRGIGGVDGGEADYLLFVAAWAEKHLTLRCDELKDQSARLNWFANRVLACDYGDNERPGEVGWRIRHDLLQGPNGERQPAFMFGSSIQRAIDSERRKDEARDTGERTPNE